MLWKARLVSDYDINIIVSGEDNASSPLQSVTQELRGVGEAAESSGGQTGGFFSNLLSTAGGFLAADVLGSIAGQVNDFVSGGIADAQGAAKLMAATGQTILTMGNAAGVSAQQVADMASSLSDAAGQSLFGDDKIQEASNLLLTFGEIKGATFDAATALTVDLAAALGGEPKAQAMMLGKALNDPIKGMSALGKAGLTFSEEQKSAIKAMQESGDMAGAQALIIAELNKQVGGQAEAQAKAAGGMVQFKAGLSETGEAIGAKLLPLLDKFGAWLSSPTVQAAINTLATLLTDGIGVAVAWLSDEAIPALQQAWTDMEPTVMQTIAFLQTSVLPVLLWLKDVLIAGLKVELAVLGWVWSNVLLPEIKAVVAWFNTYLLPVLSVIFVALRDDLPRGIAIAVQSWADFKAALASFKETYLDPIARGFDVVVGAVSGAKKQFDDFLAGVTGAIVPSWLNALIGGGGGISIPGFADGVTNFGGGLAIVGERGPELLRLPGGSDVLPGPFSLSATARGAGSSAGGASGFTWTGNLIVQGASDPQATARAVREELLKLKQRTLSVGLG